MEDQGSKKSRKEGRLHIRVSKELESRVHAYVKRHSTSLTAIGTLLFEQLLEAEALAAAETKYEAEQV